MKIKYIEFDEVFQAYLDCRRHKRNTKQQLEFEMNLWVNLYEIYKDLNSFSYVLSKSVAFVVKRPVYREVFAAMFRDRIIHHILYNKVNHIFEKHIFIDECYACRKGKGTLYGINRCYDQIKHYSENYTKSCYVLKCDLKSFFMTIDKRKLYFIAKYVIEKYGNLQHNEMVFIDYILKLIVFNCPQHNCVKRGDLALWNKLPSDKSLFNRDEYHGLPIGNLMSQILANLFLSVLDWYVTKDLGIAHYGRYVDDFYIIHEDKKYLLEVKEKIREKLNRMGVTLHPKKIYLQHYTKGITFLGAVIKPYRKYIINRTKGNFSEKLYKFSEEKQWTKEKIISWRSTINSYLGLFRQFNTYNIRKKLLLESSVLSSGYFYINNQFKALKIKKKYSVAFG